MENSNTKMVYAAISKVMQEMSVEGISKTRDNQQQHYKFRGIDDVYNALSSKLAKYGLVIIPRVIGDSREERATANGGRINYCFLKTEFDIVCAEDGSVHTAAINSEAMDSADKATNKALSAGYKYLCMLLFCIPTEGDNDADATTHAVKPKKASPPKQHEPPKQEAAVEPEKAKPASSPVIEEARQFAKQLGINQEQHTEYKSIVGGDSIAQATVIIEARDKGVTTFEQLITYVKSGTAPSK